MEADSFVMKSGGGVHTPAEREGEMCDKRLFFVGPLATPAAIATSVVVHVSPPKHSALVVSS